MCSKRPQQCNKNHAHAHFLGSRGWYIDHDNDAVCSRISLRRRSRETWIPSVNHFGGAKSMVFIKFGDHLCVRGCARLNGRRRVCWCECVWMRALVHFSLVSNKFWRANRSSQLIMFALARASRAVVGRGTC